MFIQLPNGQSFPMTWHGQKRLVKLSLKDITIFLSSTKPIILRPPTVAAQEQFLVEVREKGGGERVLCAYSGHIREFPPTNTP